MHSTLIKCWFLYYNSSANSNKITNITLYGQTQYQYVWNTNQSKFEKYLFILLNLKATDSRDTFCKKQSEKTQRLSGMFYPICDCSHRSPIVGRLKGITSILSISQGRHWFDQIPLSVTFQCMTLKSRFTYSCETSFSFIRLRKPHDVIDWLLF